MERGRENSAQLTDSSRLIAAFKRLIAPSSSALRSRASSTTSSWALATKLGIGELGVHLAELAFRLLDLARQARTLGAHVDDAGERQRRRRLAEHDLRRALRRRLGERDAVEAGEPLDRVLVALGALAQRRARRRPAPAASWRRPARSSPCAPSGSRETSRTTQPISSSASASARPSSTGHWLQRTAGSRA